MKLWGGAECNLPIAADHGGAVRHGPLRVDGPPGRGEGALDRDAAAIPGQDHGEVRQFEKYTLWRGLRQIGNVHSVLDNEESYETDEGANLYFCLLFFIALRHVIAEPRLQPICGFGGACNERGWGHVKISLRNFMGARFCDFPFHELHYS